MEKIKQRAERIIELKNLTKVYDGITVVDGVNLSIRKGEFVTFLGPSGCGKTTTLRMIAGFEMPNAGSVFLEGEDVTGVPPHKRNVNTVFQKYALFPHLNVFNNIAFGLKLKQLPNGTDKKGRPAFRKLTKAEIQDKVERALRLVNLAEYGHRDVDSLSGGQQQRVAIARALVNEPKVLLLDEPLGALDLKMRKEMQLELKRMHTELGITFIYVTHDQEEALTMSDTIVVMNDGVIQQIGTPKKIYDEPENAFVANFIGESNILSGVMVEDFRVRILGKVFECQDKGFDRNEPVDIVIRPEDIHVHNEGSPKGMLEGVVVSSVFKGTYYEMNILSSGYEFTVQDTVDRAEGERVALSLKPGDLHIMEKEKVINAVKTEITRDGGILIGDAEFPILSEAAEGYEAGDLVTAFIPFGKVELLDDEEDAVIGGNISDIIYKGNYYQVKIWLDNDTDLIVDTPYDWDNNDRVGIQIRPEDIRIERRILGADGEDEITDGDNGDTEENS